MKEKGDQQVKSRSAHLLDPELAIFASDDEMMALFRSMETPPANTEELNFQREMQLAAIELKDPAEYNVTRTEVAIPLNSEVAVRCMLYVPNAASGSRPGYLHLHGGGYVFGSPEMFDELNLKYCQRLGAVICSVDYRMGPENPVPAPLDDSYAALAWLHNNAGKWNLDVKRIAIGGESAGGGLAAALAIKARDEGKYAICHQHLSFPMLDNRTGSDEYPADPLTGEFIWSPETNQYGWSCHLGDTEPVAPYVPARLEDYSGLPPAWIYTTGLDLFRDEDILYASKLLKAGVPTELSVLPGAPHGFSLIPDTRIGKKFDDAHIDALAEALKVKI